MRKYIISPMFLMLIQLFLYCDHYEKQGWTELKIKAKNCFIKKEKATDVRENRTSGVAVTGWLFHLPSASIFSLESFDWGFPFPLNVSPVLNTEAKKKKCLDLEFQNLLLALRILPKCFIKKKNNNAL